MAMSQKQARGKNPFEERLAHEIDGATLEHHLKEGDAEDRFTILDVRDADTYNEGHIPGSVNVPYQELKERLNEIPRDKEVVTYCYHIGCLLATRAGAVLAREGYEVRDLLGGYQMWADLGHPVEPPSG